MNLDCLSSTAHYQHQRPKQSDEKIETIVPQCSAVVDFACACLPEAVVLFATGVAHHVTAGKTAVSHAMRNPVAW